MSILDPVFGWTLSLPPVLGILALSLIITLIINLIYKFTTNQSEMKNLKEQIDDYRKKIKAATKSDPKKAMKLNEEAMAVNMKYMGKSLKPTLYTFIPIIFIFAWMNAHYTYAPLAAGEPLTVDAVFVDGFTGQATLTSQTLTTKTLTSDLTIADKQTVAKFAVSGAAGKHDFTVSYKEFSENASVWFGDEPEKQLYPAKGAMKQITVDYPKIHPLGPFHLGSWYPGWLALYIVLSIVLSMSTRKLMKIY